MKIISKNNTTEELKQAIKRLQSEEKKSPFLLEISYIFESESSLHFIYALPEGTVPFKGSNQVKRHPEKLVKFYAYQIALALSKLHS